MSVRHCLIFSGGANCDDRPTRGQYTDGWSLLFSLTICKTLYCKPTLMTEVRLQCVDAERLNSCKIVLVLIPISSYAAADCLGDVIGDDRSSPTHPYLDRIG